MLVRCCAVLMWRLKVNYKLVKLVSGLIIYALIPSFWSVPKMIQINQRFKDVTNQTKWHFWATLYNVTI